MNMTTKEILEWVDNYGRPLETTEDLAKFQKELIEQINKLDFDVTEGGTKFAIGYAGSTGISGKNVNGGIYQTVELIAHEAATPYVFINDAAGNILNDPDFSDILYKKIGVDNYRTLLWGDKGESFGKNLPLNDVVSYNFMKANASGDVMLLIEENASVDSVLRKTEIPTILAKESVTSVLGIPKESLLAMDEIERFNLLKEKSIALQAEATIHHGTKFSNSGIITTYEILSFEDTSLENTFKFEIPEDMEAVGKYYERVEGLLCRDAIIEKYGFHDMAPDEAEGIIITLKIAEYRAHKNGVSAESLVKLSLDDDKKVIKATLIENERVEMRAVTHASFEGGTVPKGKMSMRMLRSKFGGSNIHGQANSLQNSIKLSTKGIQR